MYKIIAYLVFLTALASAAVRYTAVNEQTNGNQFRHEHLSNEPVGSEFIKVMEEAQKENPEKFRFEAIEYEWGKMIVEINGVRANGQDRTFWGFLREEESSLCMMRTGVSTYKIKKDEHLYMKFLTFDDRYPQCKD
ncbi:DgyrCDS8114 [Dimorphilus gyrociliatus]|uniref:DgyrCDS8114 n=1 Tax=Dimorphilus gyrociliatus TaxID=2664684 RepID=A0A7I8VUW0_9ANNE|nr:DgyrCDS8114 [Dimorphilus gyrociliatus]